MADQQLPGFEDEDESSSSPVAPKKPATGAHAKPPSLSQTGAEAAAPPIKAAGKVDYEFEESEDPPPKKPAAKPAAKPSAQPSGGSEPTPATMHPVIGDAPAAAPQDEAVDPELKPGSRQDLWNCPHCGAGNKPGRETCRTCGKSPDDAVEIPWFKQPKGKAAIGGGGVVFLLLLMVMCSGPSTALKPADASEIDSGVRIGGSASGSHEFATQQFKVRKLLSVCGRCIGAQASGTLDGSTTVVLLLGSAGKGDAGANAKVVFNNDITEVPDAPGKFAILHLIPGDVGKINLTKGQVVSLKGELLAPDSPSWSSDEPVVWVNELQTGQ